MTDPSPPTRRALLGVVASTIAWLQSRGAGASTAPDQPAAAEPQTAIAAVVDRLQRRGVDLKAFGFRGDGVTDDTDAWRRGIAFAGANRIGTVIVPAGISLVRGVIVDAAHPLPPGLTFTGEGTLDGAYTVGSRLRYAGNGICWDVAYPTGAPAATGRWAWTDMTFECIAPAGTMFSFGYPLGDPPADDPRRDPHRVIQGVAFRNVLAFGARGTGDFLRACKTYELSIDAESAIYDFRRAMWLRGCDNSEIRCRMVGNNRAVMIEHFGSNGNNNRVDIRYVGGTDVAFGGEPAYSIWDSGSMTTIGTGMLLEGTAMKAHLYLGGYGTVVNSPQLGARAPFFELAPEAREVTIYSPRCTVLDPANAPVVHPPHDPNLGSAQTDYRVRVIDAPASVAAILPDHPRIMLLGRAGRPAVAGTMLMSSAGARPSAGYVCTAQNYWASPASPGGGGIKGFVQDHTDGGRWVMHLTRDDPIEQGIVLDLVIGDDLPPGHYRLVNRMRLAAGTSHEGWSLVAVLAGKFFSNAFTFATSATHTTHSDPLDLSVATPGSTLRISLYNGSAGRAGVDLFVDALGIVPAPDAA